MRSLIFILVAISAGCSQTQPDSPTINTGTFAGEGRDRLCLDGEPGSYRGGLIAFGKGNNNCSASGSIEWQGTDPVLIPRGEGSCRIPLQIEADVVRIGETPAACGYYCGPGASLVGKSFNRTDDGARAVDLAGDPLC
jgi:hypothetical protein